MIPGRNRLSGTHRPPNQPQGQPLAWAEWSHVLTPLHRAQGYRITTTPGANPGYHRVSLWHQGKEAGHVTLEMVGPETENLWRPHSRLDPEHRGKGLGFRLYEAAYSHLYHHLRGRKIDGGLHSEDAHKVHQKLSQKYGLGYKPQPCIGGFGPYQEVLKNEASHG